MSTTGKSPVMPTMRYREADHIGVVALTHPQVMNALSYQSYLELEDAVRGTSARVLVITGEGQAFCSGDDLRAILGNPAPSPAES